MRVLLLLPIVVLAACAGAQPKDIEKMSTLDACFLGMMEPDKKPMVDAEMARRKQNCMDHEAELKKMADQEMRAGGGPAPSDSAKSTGSGSGMGGMGRY